MALFLRCFYDVICTTFLWHFFYGFFNTVIFSASSRRCRSLALYLSGWYLYRVVFTMFLWRYFYGVISTASLGRYFYGFFNGVVSNTFSRRPMSLFLQFISRPFLGRYFYNIISTMCSWRYFYCVLKTFIYGFPHVVISNLFSRRSRASCWTKGPE